MKILKATMKMLKARLPAMLLAAILIFQALPVPAYASNVIGGGNLQGRNVGSVSGNSHSRYNTTQVREDPADDITLQDIGATRFAQMDASRMMYEYVSAKGLLIVHGYGSTAGPADTIGVSDRTPGVIGGHVNAGGSHRMSWLDGFYPYFWDGKVNGPNDAVDPGSPPTAPGAGASVEDVRAYQNEYAEWRYKKEYFEYSKGSQAVYKEHKSLKASDIKYIVFDDLATAIREEISLQTDRVHDSYDLVNAEYVSGITEIAPYTFANLYNLLAVDFDSSQIKDIGAYAFAGCEKLGTGTMKGFTAEVDYQYGAKFYDGAGAASSTRKIVNHDYTPGGCDPTCDGSACTNHGSEVCYDEKNGRIILPHNLVSLGEHAFQNCKGIEEYVIHEDNNYFIASSKRSDWQASGKGWDLFTDGVIYSDGASTSDGLKETGYTRLRAAVISDYQNVPEAYRKFWVGPFGEKEPMPLEWYVKSWNPKEYITKTLKAQVGSFSEEHYNWTQIEAAVNKAKAISGHVGTGTSVETQDDSWQTAWTAQLPTSADPHYDEYKYIEGSDPWWGDKYFDSGTKNFGYDRSTYGNGIANIRDDVETLLNRGAGTNFNTLFLYPEGKTDQEFRIFPGKDPSTWDQAQSKAPVVVIGPFAFSNNRHLRTINMMACNELTTFGQGTFMNCPALTTVIFPEAGYTTNRSAVPDPGGRKPNYALTKLADDMFSQCTSLYEIYNLDRDCGKTYGLGSMEFTDVETPPGSCYSTVREFGQNCFHKCLRLSASSFRSGSRNLGASGNGLPDTLLIIGQSCFHTCKRLNYIEIHKNIEIIGDYAFSDCFNLTTIEFEDKQNNDNGGPAQDRIEDHRNKTNENKDSQFYISGSYSAAGISTALQLGNKTFEHCSSLSTLRLGSDWLIQPTTFENAIYIMLIHTKNGSHQYTIYGYQFQNGSTGQGGSKPDRAGTTEPVDPSIYFPDCAYHHGLKYQGTDWVANMP